MRESRTTELLIVTVAPTGGYHGKEANPNIPLQPEEIAQSVYDAWNEGASVAHIHARERETNQSTSNPDIFVEIDQRIRDKGCDIIIQHTTSEDFIPRLAEDKRIKSIEMNPEMASLDVTIPRMSSVRGKERFSIMTLPDIEHNAKEQLKRGIKPEVEIFNPVLMDDVEYLIDKGLLKPPYWIGFVMGMRRTNRAYMPYSPKLLMQLVDSLPSDSLFTVLGIGSDELPATIQSILLGGHVRVGFEDNVFYRKGELSESNAQMVARSVRIAKELGCEIATPTETRQILGIPPLAKHDSKD